MFELRSQQTFKANKCQPAASSRLAPSQYVTSLLYQGPDSSDTIRKHPRFIVYVVYSRSAQMETGELLDCPFCDFTDHDHFFILQHVETIHPEGGRPSPFAVREQLPDQVEPSDEDMEGARDTPSRYIECQCGEFCLLAEFESHLEMHYAEGMCFDQTLRAPADAAGPTSTLFSGEVSSPQVDFASPTPIHVPKSGHNRPVPVRSVVDRPHCSSSRKGGNAVRELFDVLRHSTSPSSRKPPQVARNRVPRRLGVRGTVSVLGSHVC